MSRKHVSKEIEVVKKFFEARKKVFEFLRKNHKRAYTPKEIGKYLKVPVHRVVLVLEDLPVHGRVMPSGLLYYMICPKEAEYYESAQSM